MGDISTFPTLPSTAKITDSHCLIDPGEYEVTYALHRFSTSFGRPNSTIWFSVISHGPAFGLYLARHYNLEWLKQGRFKPKRHSDLVREYIAVTGEPVKRLDRIPLEDRYKGRVIRAKVRTVRKNGTQKLLPELARYSVIECLLGSVTR